MIPAECSLSLSSHCCRCGSPSSSFIKEYLGASVSADTEKLKSTIDSQAKLIEEKDREIEQLKKQVRSKQTQHCASLCSQRPAELAACTGVPPVCA